MDESMILKEEIDPDYEPTQEEILEYAEFLGLELPQDQELLYLAREGLTAPLPEDWKPCKTKEGEIYYFNFETGESDWVHPCDKIYQQKAKDLKKIQNSKPIKSNVKEKRSEHDQQKRIEEERKRISHETEREIGIIKREYKETEDKENAENLQEIEKIRKRIKDQFQKELKRRTTQDLDKNDNAYIEKLQKKLEQETITAVKKEEMVFNSQVEEANTELETHLQLTEREYRELDVITDKMAQKKKKVLNENKTKLESEFKTLENQYISQLNSLKTEELTAEDYEYLNDLENKLEKEMNLELTSFKASLEQEKKKKEEESSLHLMEVKKRIERQLNEELDIYRQSKEKSELRKTEIELEIELKSLINELISIRKEHEEKENLYISTDEDFRLQRLEDEVSNIKNTFIKPPSVKEELKLSQQKLQYNREMWKAELENFRENPSYEKREELTRIKKMIDQEISIHNQKVKAFRQNTERFTNQPWENHRRTAYKKQLDKWAQFRSYSRDVMNRHEGWLNDMKQDLNRFRVKHAFI